MGYNPDKPMEGRLTDLGPPHYEQFMPPVIKAAVPMPAICKNCRLLII